ncbi:hypothetical protein GmHk_01G001069 [Glycine max]|nr:hypothetical protein GmHk_01G001069 [Glycine max]
MKEKVASIQVEAYAKVANDTIVRAIIIDLTITSIMDITPEESNAALVDEVVHHVLEPMSKLSTTSNEATSKDKGEPNVVIVYSTSSRTAHLNYAQLVVVTRDQVQDMIGQEMELFAKHSGQIIGQFRLSMQNAITTQFSNLCVVVLQTFNKLRYPCLELLLHMYPYLHLHFKQLNLHDNPLL